MAGGAAGPTELRIQQENWKAEKAKLERDFDTELHEAEREVATLQDQRVCGGGGTDCVGKRHFTAHSPSSL